MKKILIALSVVLLGTMTLSEAVAGRLPSFNKTYNSYAVDGRVIESYPVYKAGQPRTSRVCEDVRVPIYGGASAGDQTGNIVAGAIIGGVLGKALTGNNNGATAGAVIGGIAGSKKNTRRIVGYQIQRQCSDVQQQSARHIKYYEARVRIEGRIYRVRTSYRLKQGHSVRMYMPY